MTDESLIQIAVDRNVTTLNTKALLYAVDGNPPSLDATIEVEDFIAQIENDIGTRFYQPVIFWFDEDVSVKDGAYYIHIPAAFDGWNLTYIRARVITAGTTGSMTIQIYNVTDAVNMLSTVMTIASGASLDNGTGVIDAAHDDADTDDLWRVDVKTVHTTKAKGLIVMLGLTKP